ncbi:pyruvate dehydrogenase E2 component (dihydrolipoamide acetyltransferase) [Prauserella muralis]|nr:pyruvate dehydrogenase E2 component (dihydrolipoamide acetyltransferase) [Prauserella muralis]
MPRLSESMTEGTVVRWLCASGTDVVVGDEIAEIDTDKAVVGLTAHAAGVLEIVLPEGGSAAVGEVIARLGNGGQGAGAPEGGEPSAPVPAAASPVAPRSEPPAPLSTASALAPAPPPPRHRHVASPLARKRARELGVDLATVSGTGPGGRIVRTDVEAAGAARQEGPHVGSPRQVVPLTRIQQATARRLADAASIPTFSLTADAQAAALTGLRSTLGELAGPVPTVTDLVVGAAARALRDFPRLNASAADGGVVLHPRINIGVAVETTDGLIVPVVSDADLRAPTALASLSRELVDRARRGTATPEDLAGATFTVSNLGMFGVREFQAVIVPPQAAILAVGAIRTVSGAEGAVPTMTLTLSCDHRVVDGAEAARFLAGIVARIERPIELLLPAPPDPQEDSHDPRHRPSDHDVSPDGANP